MLSRWRYRACRALPSFPRGLTAGTALPMPQGAVVDGGTIARARAEGLDPDEYLANNDSYAFFRQAGGLVITGPTGTNVMDIQVIIVDRGQE